MTTKVHVDDRVSSDTLTDTISEIEISILNIIISGEPGSDLILESLTSKDFRSSDNSLIYGAAKRLHEKGEPTDVLNLFTELSKTEKTDGGSWSSYLTKIPFIALSINASNLEFYLCKLKQARILRETTETAYRMYEAAQRGDAERVQKLTEKINELQTRDTGTGSRLKPVRAADLPDIESPESLWGGLLFPGCITQLNAEPGAGKSTIAYNLAAFGAQGREFAGEPFSRRIKTLYADLETPSWLRPFKIDSICGGRPEGFYLLDTLSLSRDSADLIRLCKLEKYDLVILDTQSKVLGLQDENDNAEGSRAAELLTRLAKETEAAILLIHHTSKSGNNGKDVYRGRGASAIAASVDIVCNLEVLDQDTLKLSIAKSRVPAEFSSLTLRKAGHDRFERVSAEETGARLELFRIQDFILDLLSGGKERRTPEILELAKEAGFAKRTTELSLKRLREAGRITQIQRGVYTLGGTLIDEDEEPEDYPEVLNL
jgi:hypothetical protein